MTKRYFDDLEIRNKVEVKIDDFTAYSYEDYMFGEWYGNINIYKGNLNVFHATLESAYTKEELTEVLKRYIEKYQGKKNL